MQALNSAGVRYLIVGGLAVNAHGYVRLTRDIDIVLALDEANAVRGVTALINIGYQFAVPITPEQFADAGMREKWRAEKNMIVLKLWSDMHRRTPVDVFVYEPFDFSAEHRKAEAIDIAPGITASVVSLDTLLQMKRVAGRPHDLLDIEELERLR